ncbi:metaxin-1-like [Oppia nitens]|uniref:metaxin-1-like n=1 Tax=Oppia nitens TaxID=1686743 RepID=UPI0023D9E5C4|nr:metaxin-1-like [Oppia nitens]
MSAKFELNVWSGDWGLPSIDYKCLQMLAFCRFSGVPVKTVIVNNPLLTSLPSFKHKNTRLCDMKKLVTYLKEQNYSADFNLSSKDVSDVLAYESLLKSQLEPALLYLFWMDEQNYVQLMRGWYAKRLPFPTNYFIPNYYKNLAEKTVRSRFGGQALNGDINNTMIADSVIGEAQKCLTLLSERLKDEYFFGKNPSSFDALVFGYLAPLFKVPTHNKVLQNHIKSCDNLTKFVNKILQKYFPTVKEDNPKATQDSDTTSDNTDENEFANKWTDIILSGLVATAAMVGYALFTGLIKIDVNDEDDHELDESSKVPDLRAIFNDNYEEEDENNEN